MSGTPPKVGEGGEDLSLPSCDKTSGPRHPNPFSFTTPLPIEWWAWSGPQAPHDALPSRRPPEAIEAVAIDGVEQ